MDKKSKKAVLKSVHDGAYEICKSVAHIDDIIAGGEFCKYVAHIDDIIAGGDFCDTDVDMLKKAKRYMLWYKREYEKGGNK